MGFEIFPGIPMKQISYISENEKQPWVDEYNSLCSPGFEIIIKKL